MENDIALIELIGTIQYSAAISPVCLPTYSPADKETCAITGWGSTNRQASRDRLREAHIPIIDHERCSTPDYWGNITQPEMICAGDQNTGACFGDSGGPLVCNDNGNHEYQLVGITSFVAGNRRTQMCRNKVTKPSVFTRVHSYKDWIQSHLHRHRMRELEDQVEALQRQLASLQVRIK